MEVTGDPVLNGGVASVEVVGLPPGAIVTNIFFLSYLQKAHWQSIFLQRQVTDSIVLSSATLGNSTQIVMILYVSCHIKWPTHVQCNM